MSGGVLHRAATQEQITAARQAEPRSRLVAKPEEITHLFCCRDASWGVAFCGVEDVEVNPAAEVFCSMCVEEIRAMRPGFEADEAPTCPVDGLRCPPEDEINQRIAEETHPTS